MSDGGVDCKLILSSYPYGTIVGFQIYLTYTKELPWSYFLNEFLPLTSYYS